MIGTGQRGPATVARMLPVRPAVPMPATTTARGRPSSESALRSASAARAADSRPWAPGGAARLALWGARRGGGPQHAARVVFEHRLLVVEQRLVGDPVAVDPGRTVQGVGHQDSSACDPAEGVAAEGGTDGGEPVG